MTKYTKPSVSHEVAQLPDGEIDYNDIPELEVRTALGVPRSVLRR